MRVLSIIFIVFLGINSMAGQYLSEQDWEEAGFKQYASCTGISELGFNVDGKDQLSTIVVIASNEDGDKHGIMVHIDGARKLYGRTQAASPDGDDLLLRIFHNRFYMNFTLSDENSETTDLFIKDGDGKRKIATVTCNLGNEAPSHPETVVEAHSSVSN